MPWSSFPPLPGLSETEEPPDMTGQGLQWSAVGRRGQGDLNTPPVSPAVNTAAAAIVPLRLEPGAAQPGSISSPRLWSPWGGGRHQQGQGDQGWGHDALGNQSLGNGEDSFFADDTAQQSWATAQQSWAVVGQAILATMPPAPSGGQIHNDGAGEMAAADLWSDDWSSGLPNEGGNQWSGLLAVDPTLCLQNYWSDSADSSTTW